MAPHAAFDLASHWPSFLDHHLGSSASAGFRECFPFPSTTLALHSNCRCADAAGSCYCLVYHRQFRTAIIAPCIPAAQRKEHLACGRFCDWHPRSDFRGGISVGARPVRTPRRGYHHLGARHVFASPRSLASAFVFPCALRRDYLSRIPAAATRSAIRFASRNIPGGNHLGSVPLSVGLQGSVLRRSRRDPDALLPDLHLHHAEFCFRLAYAGNRFGARRGPRTHFFQCADLLRPWSPISRKELAPARSVGRASMAPVSLLACET